MDTAVMVVRRVVKTGEQVGKPKRGEGTRVPSLRSRIVERNRGSFQQRASISGL